MPRLSISLDSFAVLRESTSTPDFDLLAAATLAELAGADAVRVGVREELRPVDEADLLALRHAGRSLEVRMPATQSLMKTVVETHPSLVAIGGDGWDQPAGASPVEARGRDTGIATIVRGLTDAGIRAVLLVNPDLDSVKAAHTLGCWGVELYTGSIVDLPPTERDGVAAGALLDCVRLAAKLKLEVALAGGLGPRTLPILLQRVPAVSRVVVGRKLAARSALVGLDRAIRDLRAQLP